MTKVEETIRDVIIVGGGFAGLTAAVWLRRFRRDALVLSSGPPRNHRACEMHGFPGRDGVNPKELLADIRGEAESYGTDMRDGWVTSAEKTDAGFRLHTVDDTYECKRLLLATGTKDVKPDIPGFDEYDGTSAWHCPACDGYEYGGKRIVIVCWGKFITSYVREFLPHSDDISVVLHGQACEADEVAMRKLRNWGVKLFHEAITGLEGKDGQINAVRLEGGRRLPCDGLFYSIAHKPRLELMRQLACDCSGECVMSDHKQVTNVPGVYAAGDVVEIEQLVVVACAMGTIAAHNIHESLLDDSFGR